MKPDSDSQKLKGQCTKIVPNVNKNHNPSIKTTSRQKLIPTLSKPLKQQIDSISRQQWISDAAYFKAEARGFNTDYITTDWLEAEHDYIEMLVDLYLSVFREDDAMTITGLRQLAKAIGVYKPECIVSVPELICLIQVASHRSPCFRTKLDELCKDQDGCQWKTECQKLVAEWRR
jgi:Protein of unknown function (DUF2934)